MIKQLKQKYYKALRKMLFDYRKVSDSSQAIMARQRSSLGHKSLDTGQLRSRQFFLKIFKNLIY